MNGVLLACLLAVLPGQNVDQAAADFRSANERALEGDLDGAIRLYDTLLERGIDDADVYYNLGNAYAESGRAIDAIVSYERALRRAPGDREILENLEAVRVKLGAKEESAGAAVAAVDVIEPMIAPLPAETFGWIGAGADVLLFGAWYLRRRSASKKARRTLGAIVGLSIAALMLSLAVVGGHWMIARDPRGVLVEKVELREGPHAKFKTKGEASYGGRVRVLEEAEGFVHVLQEDGASGWVATKAVVRI